jgi:hypothetical protein
VLKLERHDELSLSAQAITPWSVTHLEPYIRENWRKTAPVAAR